MRLIQIKGLAKVIFCFGCVDNFENIVAFSVRRLKIKICFGLEQIKAKLVPNFTICVTTHRSNSLKKNRKKHYFSIVIYGDQKEICIDDLCKDEMAKVLHFHKPDFFITVT